MAILDLLEYEDPVGDVMISQAPREPSDEIRMGSQLVVRQSQVAVLCRDGQFLDVFGPGRHTLSTSNLPLLDKLIALPFGETPFKANVYFVGKHVFTGLGWGTPAPVIVRDADFQNIALRAFGMYSCRIDDELLFLNKLVGSKGLTTTYQVEEFIRSLIIARFFESLPKVCSSFLDLTSHYRALAELSREAICEDLKHYGLSIADFVIESITTTDDIQKMMNKATGFAAQDVERFTSLTQAEALVEAAKNPSGTTGEGLGAGLGLGLGLRMAENLSGNSPPAQVQGVKVDLISKLSTLKDLLDKGLIDQAEFDKKKEELLAGL